MGLKSKKAVHLEGLTLYTNNWEKKQHSEELTGSSPSDQESKDKRSFRQRSGVGLTKQTWVALALLAVASPSPPLAA